MPSELCELYTCSIIGIPNYLQTLYIPLHLNESLLDRQHTFDYKLDI